MIRPSTSCILCWSRIPGRTVVYSVRWSQSRLQIWLCSNTRVGQRGCPKGRCSRTGTCLPMRCRHGPGFPRRVRVRRWWKPGIEASEETRQELLQYCEQELAAYKVPTILEFRASLPKSLIGKVIRRELRAGI